MGTHVKKVWNIHNKTQSRTISGVKVSFFQPFLVGILIQLLIFESFSFALPPQLSPSDTTIPQFWRTETDANSPAQAWVEMRSRVLNDEAGRVAEEFKVPEALRQRTEFWFDIYTRYGSNDHVIHHVLYPWIVYKVIDTTTMINEGKGPLWLRTERAEKVVKAEQKKIRYTLHKMSRMKNFDNLNGLEKELFEKLQAVPGPRPKVFRQASVMIRKQLGQRDFFRNGLVNSSRYLPYMEKQFQDAGLPVELTRIPFVESSFNEKAFSRAGRAASGKSCLARAALT